jgi:hypothetical protein
MTRHTLGFIVFLLACLTWATSGLSGHPLPVVATSVACGLCAIIGVRQ